MPALWLWSLVGTLVVLAGSSWYFLVACSRPKNTAGRTYRVCRIALGVDTEQLKTDLSKIFEQYGCGDTSFHIKSLAPAARGRDLVATVDFDVVPEVLSPGKWQPRATDTRSGLITFDDRFIGFTPLHTSPSSSSPSTGIDIIALTGLGGHGFGSFKARKSNYMWLRDELGELMPSSRVWIWGYNSPVAKSVSKQTIRDLAITFAQNLEIIFGSISTDSSSARPLVFIGHSLGGLIIKQALIHISKRSEQTSHILDSMSGLLLFGVPNEGIANESLINMSNGGPNNYLIQSIGTTSEVLYTQQEEFAKYVHLTHCEVYCFYETELSPTAKKDKQGQWGKTGQLEELVTRRSATRFHDGDTSRAHHYAIARTHSDLVKFDRQDSNADFVFEILARMSLKVVKTKRHVLNKMENECLRSLYFAGMDYRKENITLADPKSGQWLYEHPKYRHWSSLPAALLSIRGNPGAGKSTIIKSLALQSAKDANIVTLSFFFFGQGSPEQYSVHSMRQSLLYQLASQCPRSSQSLFDRYNSYCETKGAFNDKWTWDETDVAEIFLTSLLEAAKGTQIQVLVDALDEAGDRNAVAIVSELKRTVEKAQEAQKAQGVKVRIAFSCRHFPEVQIDNNREIVVQEHNNHDIENYIRDSLQRQGQFSDDSVAELVSDMMKLADGNFQWAKLVLDQILEKRVSSGSTRKLRQLIADIPSDLGELYSHLIRKVRNDDRKDCIKLFQWVAFTIRPLKLAEFQVALTLDADSKLATLSDIEEHEEFFRDYSHLQERIRALSRGLITISSAQDDSSLRFIHQSVQDYVVKGGLSSLQQVTPQLISSKAHFQLFQSCLQYLRLEEVFLFCEENCSHLGISSLKECRERFAFLEYAIEHWTSHAVSVKDLGRVISIQNFRGISQKAFDLWTRYHYDKDSPYPPGSRPGLFHILAGIGMEEFFVQQEDYGPDRFLARDSRGRQPLSWAAAHGHIKVVQSLVDMNHINADDSDEYGRTPLSDAAFRGYIEIVKLLLATKNVNVNSRDKSSSTPLLRAASRGHVEVVKLLAATEGIDVNSRDEYGQTPLLEAAYEGHIEVVKLLTATEGIDVNSRDKDRRTPLSWAASKGYIEVVKLLTATEGIDVNSRDIFNRTPLLQAMSSGSVELVELLVSIDGVNINSCGAYGRTALSWAVSKSYVGLIKILINTNGINVNSRDDFGLTPLSQAISKGFVETVKLLVTTDGVDINSYDKFGRTPLLWAVSKDDVEIVKLLLATKKVNIDSRNSLGRTPLQEAQNRNHPEVVKLLATA